MDFATKIQPVLTMKNSNLKIVFALLLAGGVAFAQERPGRVEFSDGGSVAGSLSLSPGSQLRIQNGKQVYRLTLDRVAELRIAPERKNMEQAERLKPVGNELEYYGEKYPVLNFAVTATLSDGSKISGHLTTTVLYVSSADSVQKVVLASQMRGQPGQNYDAVIYPKTISFNDDAVKSSASVRLKLADLPAGSQVAGLAYETLDKLEAKAGAASGEFQMASPPGEKFFLAARAGMKVTVGWPADSDAKLADSVREAFKKTRDFYDDRRVLGAFQDAASGDIYSVSLAGRKGEVNKNKKPWECEVCRWKQAEDGRMMLAVRGVFFRDTTPGAEEVLPSVELSEKLWQVHPADSNPDSKSIWNETAP